MRNIFRHIQENIRNCQTEFEEDFKKFENESLQF